MRHNTLHIISREQNKYIALKNHQNTISSGVIIIWHTKETVLKRLFSVVSLVKENNIYTDGDSFVQTKLRLHISKGTMFDFQSKEDFLTFLNKQMRENELPAHE